MFSLARRARDGLAFAPMSKTADAPESRPPLAIVNWSWPDGSTVAGYPLGYDVAEAMVKAYVEAYPDRRAWLSIPPALKGKA